MGLDGILPRFFRFLWDCDGIFGDFDGFLEISRDLMGFMEDFLGFH